VTDRLFLDADERAQVWEQALAAIAEQADAVGGWSVKPTLGDEAIRALVAGVDFDRPIAASEALELVTRGLRGGQVQTAHPRYFGLYNPPASTMGAVADALVGAYNPQLAARAHAPFAVEVEQHLLRAVAAKLGLTGGVSSPFEGIFTTGGAEANATALTCALGAAFPDWATKGLRALPRSPTVLASREAHHSLEKAARAAGLGDRAVRRVATDEGRRLDPRALAEAIAQEKGEARAPVLVVATCGSTNAGAVDDVAAIAAVTQREGIWLHVDAAWGGLAALVPELAPLVAGFDRADSVTFDAHKALAVPMGAGMYLSRRPGTLARAFAVHSQYMPKGDDDPYARSLQWSRRFAGLKLFLTLATAGWPAYEHALRRQVQLGMRLRERLVAEGWALRNETALPVVCFVDGTRRDGSGASARHLAEIARLVAPVGWISTTRWSKEEHVLRACITNPRTTPGDVDALVEALDDARERASSSRSPIVREET
jgi:glutamate/tyrosine decarboxylase-like PLP-dependent enzyme